MKKIKLLISLIFFFTCNNQNNKIKTTMETNVADTIKNINNEISELNTVPRNNYYLIIGYFNAKNELIKVERFKNNNLLEN